MMMYYRTLGHMDDEDVTQMCHLGWIVCQNFTSLSRATRTRGRSLNDSLLSTGRDSTDDSGRYRGYRKSNK
jgi:hypothetical protein